MSTEEVPTESSEPVSERWVFLPCNLGRDPYVRIMEDVVAARIPYITTNLVSSSGTSVSGVAVPVSNYLREFGEILVKHGIVVTHEESSRDPNINFLIHTVRTGSSRARTRTSLGDIVAGVESGIPPRIRTRVRVTESGDLVPVIEEAPAPVPMDVETPLPTPVLIEEPILPDPDDDPDPEDEPDIDGGEAAESEPYVAGEVIFEATSNMEAMGSIEVVLKELSAKYGKSFSVINRHGIQCRASEIPSTLSNPDTMFDWVRIMFWSNLDLTGKKEYTGIPYPIVNGYRLSESQMDGIAPSKLFDFQILDSKEGKPIAECKDNTIAIYMDLPHRANVNCIAVLRYIVDKYFEIMGEKGLLKPLSPEERAARIERAKREAISRLVIDLGSKINTDIRDLEKSNRDHKSTMEAYEIEIRKLVQNIIDNQETIEVLKSKKSDTVEGLEAEFDRIRKLEDVDKVELEGSRLVITTKHINFLHGKTMRSGRVYKIHAMLTDFNVVITKGDSKDSELPIHPHVENNGIPCWGNLRLPLATLWRQHEFYVGVQTIIDYLKHANNGDWYYDPMKWKAA